MQKRQSKKVVTGKRKLYVFDTNVLMHDPSSLFRFQEHDIFIPMVTLEELDGHKRGMTEVARNVRQVARDLDVLVSKATATGMAGGVSLSSTGHLEATGRLFFQTNFSNLALPMGLFDGKADNQILGVVKMLRDGSPSKEVILVSKDINMRLKAKALGIPAEDYESDKVLSDSDILPTGYKELPEDFLTTHTVDSWVDGAKTMYRVVPPLALTFSVSEFVYMEKNQRTQKPFFAIVREQDGQSSVLQALTDHTAKKREVYGITARNREQNFALNLLMDPECDFVALTGVAGTGKTLMAFAAALSQVLESKRYAEIIITRATVPIGEDIGFLPGGEEEKMSPWMGAFDDNLEVLNMHAQKSGEWGRAASSDVIRSKIKIKSLNFMRGRTFLNKFVIIDEAQNLTPKQMKTIVTRAGPGTKIVCLGNLAQIDTPYLTEGSSGLTYAISRFANWPHSGHVLLRRGERSRLADYANDVL